MRAVESIMLLLALAVVGVGIWAVHKWIPQSGLSIFGRPASQEVKKPDSPPKPVTLEHKRQARSLHPIDLPIGSIEVSVPLGFAFPSPADLHAGTTRAQLVAKYGEPSARVSGVDDGILVERYYFVSHDRTRITVVTLRSGVITSAESALTTPRTLAQPQ
jgi:hypothetical protein